MSGCQLCTFQRLCDDGKLVLWVEAELLAEKLETMLRGAGLAFSQSDHYFYFADGGCSDGALALLQESLSLVEKQHIRVARGSFRAMMAATSLEQYLQVSRTEWFDEALERDAFTTYFQPIVEAEGGRRAALECLIRLEDPFRHGGEIMAAAIARGRVHVFDAYARRLAIRLGARVHEPGQKLFINFLPSSIYDPEFCMRSTLEAMASTVLRPSDIVFEVVESEQVADRRHLRKICEYYRARGFGFALDDAGTGSNSLDMIPDLAPDYVKLDKSLVNAQGDTLRESALEKFMELSQKAGARLIAEGIESAEQAERMRRLGVDWLQGYYFGRPAPGRAYGGGELVQLAAAVEREGRRLAGRVGTVVDGEAGELAEAEAIVEFPASG